MTDVPAQHGRLDAIDVVKGVAILCVLLIHAHPLGDSALFLHVVNQAVPVFLVLFGTNSFLWWRPPGRSAAEWYANRARRILVPMWAALPVWWAAALVFRPSDISLTPSLAVLHVAGYLDGVGTGWFITLVIQLVIVFPLLYAAVRRFGVLPVLAATFACALVILAVEGRIVGAWGYFNYYVFAPRFFGHVTFGMLLATILTRLDLRAVTFAAVLWLACVFAASGRLGAVAAPYGRFLTSLPLTVLALGVCARLPRLPGLTPALVWLGQSSYGIYLGQMLTHNAFLFAYGWPDLYQRLNLWLYTAVLLLGGVSFRCLGEWLLALRDRSAAVRPMPTA